MDNFGEVSFSTAFDIPKDLFFGIALYSERFPMRTSFFSSRGSKGGQKRGQNSPFSIK